MLKKTLISLAVASSIGLTGCFSDSSTGNNADPTYSISNPAIDGKTWPEFNPVTGALPLPNDLIFDTTVKDGTFTVTDSSPPVTTAINELSGASTVAPSVVQFNGKIDPTSVKTGENVFLIQLEYASGDPVQALGMGEPPTIGMTPAYRADVVTLDGNSAIRILPLEPLNPRKRYLVVITDGIKDINGDPIIQSPSYTDISDPSKPLVDAKLGAVRQLIDKLWEPTAAGYFSIAASGLTADDIALSYSFTTSNDEKVLPYIAEPAAWFSDQIATFVKVSTAKQVIATAAQASINPTYDMIDNAINNGTTGSLTNFPNIPIDNEGTTAAQALPTLYGSGAPCEGATGQPAIDCAGIALATNFQALLPTPTEATRVPSDVTIDPTSITAVGLVSAVAGQIPGASGVLAAQGTIKLPYYLGTTQSTVSTSSWKADSALAAGLNVAFDKIGLSLPQSDPSKSTAVNYLFPFPEKTTDVTVPLLALYPASGTINGVVMYQHGITTDRSAALTFGTSLAANGYAVIAIDQPLHGVAPFTTAEQNELADKLLAGASLPVNDTYRSNLIAGNLSLGLLQQLITGGCTGLSSDPATAKMQIIGGACDGIDASASASMAGLVSIEHTVANAGSTIPGLAPTANERHFDLYAKASANNAPTPMVFDPANAEGEDGSGSLYINLTNFLNTRDNGRQSVMDQMNLRASLSDITLPCGSSCAINLAGKPVYFVGHSLGTITGTPFLASVNANQLPLTWYDGTSGNPIPSTFNDIKAASLLTPGGGITRLLENSPSFAPRILLGLQQAAGLKQGDANLETYFNIFQTAVDTADPINFVDNLSASSDKILLSEVVGDTVIPNAADEQEWGIPALSGVYNAIIGGQTIPVSVDSFNAPLAGGEPLTLGLSKIVRYTNEGASHGTPVSTQPAAVFGGMVTGTVTLFMSNP